MSESNESQHSKSRRRWWLYALSLVVIAVVGVVCTLVPIWREREAIAALWERDFDIWTESRLPRFISEQIDENYETAISIRNVTVNGGVCGFWYHEPAEFDFDVEIAELANMPVTCSNKGDYPSLYSFSQVSADDLTLIGQLNNLEALGLSYVNLTDAQAEMIGGLPKLRNLSLASQQIKDADFVRAISRARGLESLYLNNLVIDPETVELIASLPNLKELGIAHPRLDNLQMADFLRRLDLEELSLHHVKLTDADCRVLGKMSRLKWLYLEFAEIDDSGLRHFRSLSNLQWVDVSNTNVTATGAAELERQLSDCRINIEKRLTIEEFRQKYDDYDGGRMMDIVHRLFDDFDGETEDTEAEPVLSAQKNAGSQ
ncbi:Leucine Rich repeats (2 copies) [Symmachiella dynata]|uniref:Leucine Rich repeats (2 copies) n=1 Tax=Symmachiella dynata TaxID=2527995 RepID=A0A517ZTC3_9PLAN|nr:hypothetical protein [Symmachiella dynata]QDU45742.1 Leucine Rich repeats (2 copies) [Symmachiella dynata]